MVGGDTGDSAISGSSNRAPGPLSTKGGRLGTRARLLVCRNPYGQRKITAPGDAIFFSTRVLRVFGAGFWRCWPGRRRAYSSGNSQFRPTRPRPWPRSPSRCCPAGCRRLSGVWQMRAGGLRLKGSDGGAGAHAFSSSPAREKLLNVTAIVASSSTPPSAGCPARQYSHRCRAI